MITKPTPTPLPPATPYVFIPPSYSLWASTDYAIQSWNLLGDVRLVIQALFLIGLVIVGAYILKRFFEVTTRKDSEG